MKQRNEGHIFDAQAISKMELLILNALDCMRSMTPFPFLDIFLSLFGLKDPPFIQALKCRTSKIIFHAHNGTTSYTIMFMYSVSLMFLVNNSSISNFHS
jgi:beta-lactamase class D